MSKLLLRIGFAGLVVAAGIAVYKHFLTPQAKDSLKDMAKKGVQLGLDVHESIAGKRESDEAERIAANQRFIQEEWKKAGF